MKKLAIISILLGMTFCLPFKMFAQQMMEHKQQKLSKWDIGTAQYSGITALGNGRYAVVSDKEPSDGFFVFSIEQDSISGKVTHVAMEGFYGNPTPKLDTNGFSVRDTEGIAYFAPQSTIFISGEGDQRILEYDLKGMPTGRELQVPSVFSRHNIYNNYGFESLSYHPATHTFWTVTESTLPADGCAAGPEHPGAVNLLRLQSFGDDLQPLAQYAYRMDAGRKEDFGKYYTYGVSDVTALADGSVLVLERELNVPKGYMSSEVVCKIFRVYPNEGWQIDASTDLNTLDPNHFLHKTLLARFVTQLHPLHNAYANYEGMCLGATLADGRQTLLLINDSQAGAGNKMVRLQDYIKVMVF